MPAPDDIYRHDVDFTTLALQYPDFAKKLKSNRQLDFSDPESVRQLTKTLLHRDFDITIDLPEDRLCPPVPNRFNYILFIQRLLDNTSPDFRDGYDPDRQVIGLDIGTGASAIYPLLACQQRPKWLFLATEIDDKSRMYATKNIATNVLQSRIKLLDTDTTGAQLIPSAQLERFDRIDILMTNPPFYESQESMSESARSKSRPANSSCTGAPVEMITPGGEVSFVSRLIDESGLSTNKTRIQWFTAMLGKLFSVGVVVEILRKKGCTNFAVTEFIQGQKTRRWCVAWSWFGFRPSNAVARSVGSGVEKKFLPPPTEIEFDVHADLGMLETMIGEEVEKLDVLWKYIPAKRVGMVMSKEGDVWSRKARRRRVHQDQEMADDDEDEKQVEEDEEPAPALVARITLSAVVAGDGQKGTAETHVHLKHLQGHDSVLFESFCGWLKRKVS
ncbi:hypothetical protein LTR10_012602 [Elasticomyces elasticus]|uniref:U6 small nuclear RNA (adenine-(43)-N(6))-methyltransferase n=1 Tax=Exophiala sideris TaxID=1016849 RepID=A0ABR0JRH6_9EURO|nr:hypothetical protein LTR10_012602 [Elasticomyces elasticus]KAK5040197.1 hypothetical protein LTS07_000694 [Exophiala sideris]KAK5043377.1 hypothetical protein LTR13_001148 [Exophiala sideris]KAK5068575.1 hypothetical protein LTR69_000695 [Exophiala sideris]KAK5186173.1 hypothetical protein LTR44_001228 [Eurotiomycetes sp. CCFEE 6388]